MRVTLVLILAASSCKCDHRGDVSECNPGEFLVIPLVTVGVRTSQFDLLLLLPSQNTAGLHSEGDIETTSL